MTRNPRYIALSCTDIDSMDGFAIKLYFLEPLSNISRFYAASTHKTYCYIADVFG